MFLSELDILAYNVVAFVNDYGIWYLGGVVIYALCHSIMSGFVNRNWSFDDLVEAFFFPICIMNVLGVLSMFVVTKIRDSKETKDSK